MTRKANRNATPVSSTAPVLHFLPHEVRTLKHNNPGPSGALGGWQRLENWLVGHIDPATGDCPLTPPIYSRLTHYLTASYGPGGPNKRVRDTCFPALRRIGINLQPVPKSPKVATRATREARPNA